MKAPWRKPRGFVASAARLTGGDSEYQRRLSQPWQYRALGYYDELGEVRYASQFYARMLARVVIYPATLGSDGKLTKIESGPAVDLLARVQDPGGGRQRMQYDYGRLMFTTGEGVLLVTGEDTDDERWRFLWREEIRMVDGIAIRKLANGQLSSERGTGYRMWTPSPIHSDLADSPLHSVLDIAEELLLLTAAVRATAVTRLTKGVLLLPTEVSPAPFEEGLDEDPELSPFMQRLTENIAAQIEDPGTAKACAPLVLEGGYDYLDQVRYLPLHDPQMDYMERDLRIEAIKRMALGLDFPPEALLGMTDANHWTGQQVMHDMWRSHGVPVADRWVTDLNDTYLRPALREAGHDATDVVIGYDDSQVVVSPDRTAIADEAMDRAQISFAGYRELKGIPEDMAPSKEEQAFVFGIKTRDPVVAGLEEQAPAVRGPQAGPNVNDGQVTSPPQPTKGRAVSRQEARVASVMGAADMALRQCRAKAGARLRTSVSSPPRNVKRCEECQQAIDGLPNAMVASALGEDVLRDMAARDPLALVAGGTDDFRSCLEEWGIPGPHTSVLCERIETFAATTLFEPNTPELPPGFASHIDAALEVSDRVAVA